MIPKLNTLFLHYHSFHSKVTKTLGVLQTTNQELSNVQARTRCKTCPFISNMVKISGPNRSAKITDHFTCISVSVIYCIICTQCKRVYIRQNREKIGGLLMWTHYTFYTFHMELVIREICLGDLKAQISNLPFSCSKNTDPSDELR